MTVIPISGSYAGRFKGVRNVRSRKLRGNSFLKESSQQNDDSTCLFKPADFVVWNKSGSDGKLTKPYELLCVDRETW